MSHQTPSKPCTQYGYVKTPIGNVWAVTSAYRINTKREGWAEIEANLAAKNPYQKQFEGVG